MTPATASAADPNCTGVRFSVLLPAKVRPATSASLVHPEYIRREA
jgi:hypothetical protein